MDRQMYHYATVSKALQEGCTGNAVVKSGKLYAVKCHVYRLYVGLPARCRGVGR